MLPLAIQCTEHAIPLLLSLRLQVPHMAATTDTRLVVLQLQTAQKHSFAAASPGNSGTVPARRHIDRQLAPQIGSKTRSRFVTHGTKSSKDEAWLHDYSDVNPLSASFGHHGVGRKQFLTALSGKFTSPDDPRSHHLHDMHYASMQMTCALQAASWHPY